MSDMKTTASIPLRQLLKERDSLVKSLSGLKHILRGSIVKQGNICGKSVCVCKRRKNPVLHGPYNYLSHRSRKTINTIFLTENKLRRAKNGIRQYNEAIELVYRIAEINFRILRYHYAELKECVI
jgi:hypothetical protein